MKGLGIVLSHSLQERRGVKFIEYKGLNNITAVFSTRSGGVSEGPFRSLNLALHNGDQEGRVVRNREIFGETVGAPLPQWVTARQVHGKAVAAVSDQEQGMGCRDYGSALWDTDGMVTACTQLALVTFYADCVPVYLADDRRGVVAMLHAGWKGTVAAITAEAVRKMLSEYGCAAADIKAIIGPSVGPCCYQVDEPVIERFRQAYSWWEALFNFQEGGRALLNLWEANKRVLLQAGLPEANIYITGLCSSCREDLFFSYRRDDGRTGRMAALVMLNV